MYKQIMLSIITAAEVNRACFNTPRHCLPLELGYALREDDDNDDINTRYKIMKCNTM